MKLIYVFDLGETLMEYNGMPLIWSEYYFSGISKINKTFSLNLSSEISGFRKPNKAGLELIAKHFNQAVSSLIFIGDEQKDIDCAKNAGCEFVNIKEFVKNFVS